MQFGLTDRVGKWQEQRDSLFRKMKAALLPVPDSSGRREMWGFPRGRGGPYRAGVVTGDFSNG
jgi:hypothetical protein